MANKLYSVEFPLRCSPHILFDLISTASGLGEWFADHVEDHKNEFTFSWNGSKENAVMIDKQEELSVKFRWDYQATDEFFEFYIEHNDVTNETLLKITDFAEDRDIPDQIKLWESQVQSLKHRVGA